MFVYEQIKHIVLVLSLLQGYDNALKDYTVNLSFVFHSTYTRDRLKAFGGCTMSLNVGRVSF